MSVSCIVPFRSTDPYREELFELVMSRIMTLMPDWELVVGDCEGEFSRSAARNAGASFAEGDVLVFCDADTVWNADFLDAAVDLAKPWALPYSMYYNLNEKATEALLDDDSMDDLVVPSESEYDHALDYVISGTVVVTREAYDTVGGYDERFIGWGYEDDAFATALTAFYGGPQRVDGFVCHLWHPVDNGDAFDHPYIDHNRKLHQQYKQAARNENSMRLYLNERPQ